MTDWNQSLGLMLYDLQYGQNGKNQPGYFDANVVRGVLHCDREAAGPNGEPPVKILGWEKEETAA